MPPLPSPPLLVITDRRLAARPLPALAVAAFAGGCRWLLLRDKDLPPAERLALGRDLAALAARAGARLSVSADVDLAAALGAGVHLQAAGRIAEARRRLGPAAVIGLSAHGPADLAAAAEAGADYATYSPIFASPSKPGYGPALGLGGLRAAAALAGLPLLALGGVTAGNLAACLEAGAAGGAVMGPAMRAADPGAEIAALLAAGGWMPAAG